MAAAQAAEIIWSDTAPYTTGGQDTPRPFELTGEEKTFIHPITGKPVTVYRIRATVYYPEHTYQEVSAGDLGGWVQSLDQLSDDSWVADEAILFDDALLEHASRMEKNALAFGSAQLDWEIIFGGEAWIYERASIYGQGAVEGTVRILGDARMSFDYHEIFGNTMICGERFPEGFRMDAELTLYDGKVHANLPAEIQVWDELDQWRDEQAEQLYQRYLTQPVASEGPSKKLLFLAQAVFGDTPLAVERLRNRTYNFGNHLGGLESADQVKLIEAYLCLHEPTRPRPDTSLLDNLPNAPEPAPYPVTLRTSGTDSAVSAGEDSPE